MPYQLKPGQESFEVVDGPDAGKKYDKGTLYDVIPTHETHRFVIVLPDPTPETTTSDEPMHAWVDADPESRPSTSKKGVKPHA